MSLQVIQQPVSDTAQSRVFRVSITNVPADVHRWIAANPGQSALLIANGILFFTPAALTGPLLATMGFGASGPVAGSVAVWLQSILGNVGARSVFAYLQSAGMGGYGVATINGIVQALGMISGPAVAAYNWPRRPNTRTSESTIPAPSSTVLNTSDPNYQAMLTTEPLDTANIVDAPADLSVFDYLTNSDTDADNADLCSARRWAWYCKDPACPKYWSAWSCKSNFWLHMYETSVHRADVRTHTRAGRRELAREWRVETDREMKEPKEPKPDPLGNE